MTLVPNYLSNLSTDIISGDINGHNVMEKILIIGHLLKKLRPLGILTKILKYSDNVYNNSVK